MALRVKLLSAKGAGTTPPPSSGIVIPSDAHRLSDSERMAILCGAARFLGFSPTWRRHNHTQINVQLTEPGDRDALVQQYIGWKQSVATTTPHHHDHKSTYFAGGAGAASEAPQVQPWQKPIINIGFEHGGAVASRAFTILADAVRDFERNIVAAEARFKAQQNRGSV